MIWRWIRRLLGMIELAHVAVPRGFIWGKQDVQSDLFGAGASICGEGEAGADWILILQCDLERDLGRVLGVLETRDIPAECVDWSPPTAPFFTDLEWSVMMNGMESLNDGRSLRRRSW